MRAEDTINLPVFGETELAFDWLRASPICLSWTGIFANGARASRALVFPAWEAFTLPHGDKAIVEQMLLQAIRRDFSQQGSQEERQEAHNLPMREFDSRPCDHSGIGGTYAWIGREAPIRRGSIILDDGGAFVAQVPEGPLAFGSYFDRLNSIHQAERVHLVDESRKMFTRPAEWFATVDTP
jgi:hypothetical protein